MTRELERRLQELEDYRDIQELKARYCNGCDGGWDRPSHAADQVSALFTEYALWDGSPALPVARGRAEIRALMESFRGRFPFIVHMVTNPVIRIEGDSATGQWHAILYYRTRRGPATGYGIYEDRFERTAAGWRFCELRIIHLTQVAHPEPE